MKAPWHAALGGRMFIYCTGGLVLGIAIAAAVVIASDLTGEQLLSFIQGMFATGVAGVGGERVLTRRKLGNPDYYSSAAPTPPAGENLEDP